MKAFKLLGFFLPKEHRTKLKELEREHRRIASLVDTFYNLLGERNWVFTGDLNMPAVEHIVDTDDSDTAEIRLINYYKTEGSIASPLRRLHRLESMRPRINLLHKALSDYEAGRFYSTVLVLLSVMDGFVNDVDKGLRKGLHARTSEDMVAWDSVAGHHMGLGHAHQSFLKGFFKTDESKVTELFRNGIMHGTLVNFDNEIVSSKAWNRLFAVADWADSRERQSKPTEQEPSLGESLSRWQKAQDRKSEIEQWQPHDYDPSDSPEEQSDVLRACGDYLVAWQKRRWGLVGEHLLELGAPRSSTGKLAVLAKDLYEPLVLISWTIRHVRHVTAAVAHTDVDLLVDGATYRTDLRWVRVGDAGSTAMEWEPGRWLLSLYGPSQFLKAEALVDSPGLRDENRPDPT